METLDLIRDRILAALPAARLELIHNPAPAAEHSLMVGAEHAVAVARLLQTDAGLRLDYCSNVTGVDWPDRVEKSKVKVRQTVDGVEKEVEEMRETAIPGFLEVVYHLYSMERKHGPVILRMRTGNRTDDVRLPSLTPVWRSCELQEREIFDLYGIVFDGHPDLRRLLMWDGFKDFPMRKDYVEPDDYEYEPTAHDAVAERARRHLPVTKGAGA